MGSVTASLLILPTETIGGIKAIFISVYSKASVVACSP